MTDRPDVAVRLVPLKFCLRHCRVLRLVSVPPRDADIVILCPVTRPADFPTEARARERRLERVKGIEPSSSAWKAVALPLSYTRLFDFLLSSPSLATAGLPRRSCATLIFARLRPCGLRRGSRRRCAAKTGGGSRTRTYEGEASGFTVRPLCRSGHSPDDQFSVFAQLVIADHRPAQKHRPPVWVRT